MRKPKAKPRNRLLAGANVGDRASARPPRQSIQLETGEIVCGHWVDSPEVNQAIAHLETFGGQPHIDGPKSTDLPTRSPSKQLESIEFSLLPPILEKSNTQPPKFWIEESWKTINGKRYGPYRIKRWRDERGKKRSQYLGKSPHQEPNGNEY